MKYLKVIFLITILNIALISKLKAQLTVTDGYTAQQLADYFTGESITPFNCELWGEDVQSGKFTFVGDELGVNSGVILSTGSIFDAPGPNSSIHTSTQLGGYGDDYLDDTYGFDTYDAVILEFDFTVQSDEIEFNYVFLSEEYNEAVGGSYNDVFAFTIQGPGITGEKNLAVIPGTTTPITINTVNNDEHWQFYNDNTNGNTNIEFDGYTTLMTAKAEGLQPCETYHMRLVIADGGDESMDSGVLLQESSLSQSIVTVNTETYSGNDISIEGCVNAEFKFSLDKAQTEDVEINLTIKGTAVNGVDYDYIDPKVIIPAGQIQSTLVLKAINDGLDEGQESVFLIYQATPCAAPDTAKLFIDDFDQIIFTAEGQDASCNGASDGQINIDIQGGYQPYTFYITDTLTLEQQTFTSLPVTGLDSGTYKIDVIDSYGCKAEDVVFGGQFDAGQTFLPDGGQGIESTINISGFEDGQVLESADQILGLTAILEHSYVNDLSVEVQAPNGSSVILKQFNPSGGGSCDLGEPVASGPIDEWNSANITPGLGYEYTWNANPVFGTFNQELQGDIPYHTYVSTYGNTLSDYYLPAGSYAPENSFDAFIGTPLNGDWKMIVTDNMALDNGYIFGWNLSLKADRPDSIITISHPSKPNITSDITNSTCGQSNGSIDITVSGGSSPYSFLWNTGATTEDIADIASGSYNVNITDANTCTYNFLFNVSDDGGSLTLSADVEDETCPDENNGSIDLTASGTAPLNYSWSNGATTEDIDNLAPDNYTVTVSDANNCNKVETYTVNPATEINLTFEITDEHCGDHEGLIDITVAGGIPPYTYSWSNGATTEDIDELQQGDYTVTVTDQNSCSKQQTFHITNYVGDCIPDCDLEITDADITNESCGEQNGAINLTVFTSFSPYNITWNNGETTENLNYLSEGEYIVTITDAENCTLKDTFIIENQSGDFQISNAVSIEETCGNGTGSIDITVSGGAAPYSYEWSNGETTQDIANLHAGSYTVTVSDANNCSISKTVNVENNSGDLEQTWGNAVNEICGNGQGSIDISISGGETPYTYSWSNGETTQDLINIHEGNYQCTITDNAGCVIRTPEYEIENESGTLNIDDIDVDNEVCGNGQGEIEIVVSGGTEPYTYSWSNGETTRDIFNLSAGTYTGTVYDNNGCETSTGELTIINEPGDLRLQEINVIDEICNNHEGEIDITVTGGTEPYSYSWSNGNTAEDLTGLNAGNYSCEVTDNNGCNLNVSTTVHEDNGDLEVTEINVTDENCGNSDGAVNITVTGQNTPFVYNWSNGEHTQDISSLSAGTYSCTVTDDEGCTENIEATVNNITATLSLDGYSLTNEVCGNGQGAIDITVSGTETPFSFSWNNGETTEDISGLSAGTYTCEITDASGCKIIAGPYTVNDYAGTLSVDNIDKTDEQCGDASGAIDITVSGGTIPYSFSWSNGETTEDISGLSAGIYTFTVTDNNNCSISNDVEILNDAGDLRLDSYDKTDETCNNNNGAIDVTVSGGNAPLNFLWNTGQTTEDIDNLNEGIYRLTITDADNCTLVTQDFYIINSSGDISITTEDITDETCGLSNGAIDITAENGQAPYEFAWSNGADTEDITNISAGNYSVTVTDNIGCTYSETFTINNITNGFEISDANITDESCGTSDGTIDITVSGGTTPYSFSWSNGETTEDVSGLSAGTYTVTVSDNAGCSVTNSYDVMNVTTGLEITLIEKQDDYCNNHTGFINLNIHDGEAPYTIIWSNGATTENINNLAAGTYTVNVTDNSGCATSSEYHITNEINENLGITNIIVTDDVCNQGNGKIEFSPLTPGTYTYKLNDANDTDTPVFENLNADDYVISVHDADGCAVSEDVTVDNDAGFTAEAYSNPEFCSGNDGDIYIFVNPPNGDYSFSWDNGMSGEYISGLSAGTYTCTITDNSNGCTDIITAEVENQGWYSVSATVTDETCGQADGAIDLSLVGSDGYTFNWSNGETTEDIENLSAGEYTCNISDAYGCAVSITKTVENNTGTMEVSDYVHDDFCAESSGYINLTITGADNYSVLWNTGATTQNLENLSEGTYSVNVTNDDTGCEYNGTFEIQTAGIYTVSENITQSSCSTCDDGAIDITLNPSDYGYTFNWSNGETTEDIENLLPGSYEITINNEYNCEYNDSFYVNTVNIEFTEKEIKLKIYPNPAYDYLYIDYEIKNAENINISIYDLTGKKISEKTIYGNNGTSEINISSFNEGIYFIKVENNEVTKTFKIFKKR
ncbi:MAG: T9SS type A sorting domain-containing protein [Chlorobi bacterium]|nr:T9SS type A sorting domain-containing protein [Chlorobiota bacterium]